MENKNKPEIRFKGLNDNWSKNELGILCEIIDGDRGVNYPSSNDFYKKEHTLFLNASNVTKNGFNFQENQYITLEKSNLLGNGKLNTNDIVLTSRGSVGHIAWYNEDVSKIYPHIRINSGMLLLRSKKGTQPIYLSQFLKSSLGENAIYKITFGSAQPQLTKKEVFKLNVCIPLNSTVQNLIGNFFENLDNLITEHKQKHTKLKALKQAMLDKIFPKQGQLVPEIRFKGFEGDWENLRLGNIGDPFTGLSGKSKNDFGHGEGRYIPYMNVFSNPISDLNMLEKIEIDSSQHEVISGDVLFTVSSETAEEVGMSSVWTGNKKNVYLNSFCFGYRPKIKLDNYFLANLLRTRAFREQMTLLAQGISRYNISKNKVMNLTISLPEFDEQIVIGKYFKNVDSLINQHSQQITKLTNLKKAFLAKMFI